MAHLPSGGLGSPHVRLRPECLRQAFPHQRGRRISYWRPSGAASIALCWTRPPLRSPTLACSEYSATSSPLGFTSDRRPSTRRTLYLPTIRSVTSAPLLSRCTSLTP